MSRIINAEISEECKPWNAPQLNVAKDNNFDFKASHQHDAVDPREREQLELIRQQAYEKSYAKGYMEGITKGQAEVQEKVSALHEVMASLALPLPEVDNKVVDELVQLCIVISKQMIRRELKISPDEVVAVVREALNMLPVTAADIKIELNPEDVKIIKSALIRPDSEPGWSILENASISQGGCRVVTSTSRIDATVEHRMSAIIAEVLGGERKQDNSDDG